MFGTSTPQFPTPFIQQPPSMNTNRNVSDELTSYRPHVSEMGDLASQTELQKARMAADASKYPAQLAMQRWGQLFPLVSASLRRGPGQLGAIGATGPGPGINADNVLSEGQIQGQVNQMRAGNDAKAAAQTYGAQQSAAGRGLSSRSPLLSELGAAFQGQAMAASTQGEQQTRYDAAQGNAKQRLAAQTAQEQQFASRRQEEIGRQANQVKQQSALLSMLGGIV